MRFALRRRRRRWRKSASVALLNLNCGFINSATKIKTNVKQTTSIDFLNSLIASMFVAVTCFICLLPVNTLVNASTNINNQFASNNLHQQQQLQLAQTLQLFSGNESTNLDANHFKVAELDGEFLLLGARNVVYNVSLADLREQRRIEWPSSDDDVRTCRIKGKSADLCQNFVRVIKRQSHNSLLVCGTNSCKPKCRTYDILAQPLELSASNERPELSYVQTSESSGEGVCPYHENQNNSATLASDGQLYTATNAKFAGVDALIHRHPLRTEQFNPRHLNAPNFVASFQYDKHVYFLFRETAVEYMNCGKTVYSRIARVCMNDVGGNSRANKDRWTSFAKARLNCSLPGDFPFYFDEIQASTSVVKSSINELGSPQQARNQHTELLYAVFTTPQNSIGGSAVCAFKMSDIVAAFDGPFKAQADGNSNWLPVPESRVPQSPRPGSCSNNSRLLPDDHINFIKDNPLMDTAVQSLWSHPLVMMASINFRFTQIAVDPQVELLNNVLTRTDVVFVGTDDGRVFKLINTHNLPLSSSALTTTMTSSSQHLMPRQPSNVAVGQQQAAALSSRSPYKLNGASNIQAEQQQQQQQSSMRTLQHSIAAAQIAAATAANREQLPDVSSETIVIEELHLFDAKTPIVGLKIYYPPASKPRPIFSSFATNNDDSSIPQSQQQALPQPQSPLDYPKLIVISGKQVKAIPLSRCERAQTCLDCLALHDPYCAWHSHALACMPLGRSASQQQQLPTNSPLAYANDTLAWWQQCSNSASNAFSQQQQQQQLLQQQTVGAPLRSFFSSHLQVPSRYDYASGHHLSHASIVPAMPFSSLTNGNSYNSLSPVYTSGQSRQAPVSECLTFCGANINYSPPITSSGSSSTASEASILDVNLPALNCVEQQFTSTTHNNANFNTNNPLVQKANISLYSSESFYIGLIVAIAGGIIFGLTLGFSLGKNSRKHDSSICSSTFDEANLYLASTASHNNHNSSNTHSLAYGHAGSARLNHPLLHPSTALTPNGRLLANNHPYGASNPNGTNHLLSSSQQQQQQHQQQQQQHPYGVSDATQRLLQHNEFKSHHQQQQHHHEKQHSSSSHASSTSNNHNNSNHIYASASVSPQPPPLPPPLVGSNMSTKTLLAAAQLNASNHLTNNTSQHHQQLGSCASSTNTSSTSTTAPMHDHQNQQLYLNQQLTYCNSNNTSSHQQQSAQQQLQAQQSQPFQRSFSSSGTTTATTNSARSSGSQNSNNLHHNVGDIISCSTKKSQGKIFAMQPNHNKMHL